MKQGLIKFCMALSIGFCFLCGCAGAEEKDDGTIEGTLATVAFADDLMVVKMPDNSKYYYETCARTLMLTADGSTEPFANTPDQCNSFMTSMCGYYLGDTYFRATSPGCDVVECKPADGVEFSGFIGSYKVNGTKPIPEEINNNYCKDAPISEPAEYFGVVTATLTLYSDSACKNAKISTKTFTHSE